MDTNTSGQDNGQEDTLLIIEDLDNIPAVAEKTAVVIPGGRRGFLYPSGAIKDGAGHFITNRQPGAVQAFNREDARKAGQKSQSRRSEAVQAAIIAGTQAKDINEGVQFVAAQIVKIIMREGGSDRDKIQAFKELMRFGGLAADLTGHQGPAVVVSGGSGLSNEALRALNVLLPAIEARLSGQD